jgi:hypothetical protein
VPDRKYNPLVELIHFGRATFQSSTRTGTKLVMGKKKSSSGSVWPLYFGVLFFDFSFRSLYTELHFHHTENLELFFLPELLLKLELSERAAEQFIRFCSLDGDASPL